MPFRLAGSAGCEHWALCRRRIGAAYLFYWLRGWFKDADENKRLLAETHWRTALRLLDKMSYLRGAS